MQAFSSSRRSRTLWAVVGRPHSIGSRVSFQSYATRTGSSKGTHPNEQVFSVNSPRELLSHLSQFIVGQERAKRILSVAVFNHYSRIQHRLSKIQPSPPPSPPQLVPAEAPTLTAATPSPSYEPDPTITKTPHPDPTKIHNTVDEDLLSDFPGQRRGRDWTKPEAFFDRIVPSPPPSLLGRVLKPAQFPNSLRPVPLPETDPVAPAAATQIPEPRAKPTSSAKALSSAYDDVEIEKSNVLMIGPTGTGKTLLAKTLAKILDVPFASCDATSYTQAGYIGDDVENSVLRLLQAADYDINRAEVGIIHIDEADKLARRGGGDGGGWGGRDVGGEGVQQALLRLMEGTTVSLTAKAPPIVSTATGSAAPEFNPNDPMNRGFGVGAGKKSVTDGLPSHSGSGGAGSTGSKGETFIVDTSNILFILSGAFVGLDKIINTRIGKGSMGFGADLPSKSFSQLSTPSTDTKQQSISNLTTADLHSYGLIPEFVGRLPILSPLEPLTVDDLVRILTEPRSALIKQYCVLFERFGCEMRFSRRALRAIADVGMERGGGARGLRGALEELLLDSMFEVPGSSVRYALITAAVVRKEQPALYFSRGQLTAFRQALDADDWEPDAKVEEEEEEPEKLSANG